MKKHHDLEIENEAFNPSYLEFKFQKIGIGFLLLILIASLLGLLGPGLLSRKHLDSSNYSIQYDRFIQVEDLTQLKFLIKNNNTVLNISLSNDFTKHFVLESITPRPIAEIVDANQTTYRFLNLGKAQNVIIIFNLNPIEFGIAKGVVSLADGMKHSIRQIIFP